MRLFIALPLPAGVKEKLLNLRQPVKGMRWQCKDQLHLTLKFVGEVDETTTDELRKKLGKIVHPKLSLTIAGMGYFPESKHPKVVWVGIDENASLKELHKKIEDQCQIFGIPPESRSFKPHVTISRTKNTPKRAVTSFINKHKKFTVRDISIQEFVLYESKLHPDGARHQRVATYILKSDE
jgi:2'-5' RNA ligase